MRKIMRTKIIIFFLKKKKKKERKKKKTQTLGNTSKIGI